MDNNNDKDTSWLSKLGITVIILLIILFFVALLYMYH